MHSDAGSESWPSVGIVVLNWNGGDLVVECLDSLSRSRWPNQQVFLVDNGSTDGSPAVVAERFPDTTIVNNRTNLGFAEGNNRGIRAALAAGVDYVLVLNNDAQVDEDAVGHLVREIAARPDASAVAPLIYFADPPDLIWCAGASFNPARGRAGRMLGYRQRDSGDDTNVRATDRLTGAAMLVARRAIERTGMFDGELFFLYEDVDWSLRMRAAGFNLYLVPSARVWHHVAATQRDEHSTLSIYYGMRNQMAVSRRHAPLGRLATARRDLVAFAVNASRVPYSDRRLAGIRALFEGLRDGLAGRLGPWKQGS